MFLLEMECRLDEILSLRVIKSILAHSHKEITARSTCITVTSQRKRDSCSREGADGLHVEEMKHRRFCQN